MLLFDCLIEDVVFWFNLGYCVCSVVMVLIVYIVICEDGLVGLGDQFECVGVGVLFYSWCCGDEQLIVVSQFECVIGCEDLVCLVCCVGFLFGIFVVIVVELLLLLVDLLIIINGVLVVLCVCCLDVYVVGVVGQVVWGVVVCSILVCLIGVLLILVISWLYLVIWVLLQDMFVMWVVLVVDVWLLLVVDGDYVWVDGWLLCVVDQCWVWNVLVQCYGEDNVCG